MFKNYLPKATCALVLSTMSYFSIAQDTTQSIKPIEEIFNLSLEELLNITVVSASKKEEKLTEAPSNITVITERQIKASGARDIKDIIRRVAGFQVIADRDEWVFAARGNVSDNNQKYLILVDGIRMNSIENFGPGNIIEIPNNLSNVSRIEVIKGPGSAVWGADALAGVINIITKDGKDLNGQKNIAITYGDGNYVVGDFQVGHEVNDDVNFAVMGSFSTQGGKEITQDAATGLPYLNNPYTHITAGGDTVSNHPYGDYTTNLDQHNFGYMLQMKAKVHKLKINAMTFETEVFNRHFESNTSRENYLTTNKSFIQARYDDKIGETFNYTLKASTFSNYSEYRPGKQGDSTKLPINIAWRDRGLILNAEAQKAIIPDKFNLNAGVSYQFTKAGPNQRINSFNPDSSNLTTDGFWFDPYLEDHQIGGYMMFDFKPTDWMTLHVGTRGDFNNQRGNDPFNLNPRFGLIVNPMENSAFKVLYNKGYLRPANFQSAGGDVSSEEMSQVDVIWMQNVGKVNYNVTYFWQKLTGFINILPGFGFANTGDYSSTGVEVDVNYSPNVNHTIWANLSVTNAKGDNFPTDLAYNNRRVDLDGKLLSYPGMNFNLGSMHFLLDNKLTIAPTIRFVGATKYRQVPVDVAIDDIEANYETTPAFTYLDINVGYQVNKKLAFNLYVDNLLNETRKTHLTVWNGGLEQYGTFWNLKMRLSL